MPDMGIINHIRDVLCEHESLVKRGMKDVIYVNLPPQPPASMITLEVEEIWSSINFGEIGPYVRVRFRASSIIETKPGVDAIQIAELVKSSLDGCIVHLKDNHTATCRHTNSVIDLPKPRRTVHHYFEVLIRKIESVKSITKESVMDPNLDYR